MLYDFYRVTHDALAFCFWTIPTILVGLAMIVIGLGHGYFQQKRENDFEEELEEEE
jgi:uncharacterized membrane protein